MRWLAIAGILIASLLANLVLNISFPLIPIYIICAVMVIYNYILFQQAHSLTAIASGLAPQGIGILLRRFSTFGLVPKSASPLIEKARIIGNIHIALDLLSLTTLLHFTGGIANPFIFYFIFHVIIAGIILHYRITYILATLAILLVLLLVGLEYSGVIPPIQLEGFVSADLHHQEAYILGILVALATCLYGSAYMVTRISGELRKQQRTVVALKDIGLDQKNKELQRVTKELAKLEEGRKQLLNFLGIVAHDLKAPLSAVQSYLQLIVRGFVGEVLEKQKELLDRSIYRIAELLNLISDLLDISRIESGQIVNEVEEVSLSRILDSAVEDVQAQANSKKVSIKVSVSESLPHITASGVLLQQLMTNLFTNAIKFTPEGGEIKCQAEDSNKVIQVEVSDTGVGITDEDLPHIFEDFYRSKDPEKAGTGLGLSIVKRIVEAHKGKIKVESPNPESKTGRGCKFTFTLPKNLPATARKKGKTKAVGTKRATKVKTV
jgi:signal transduction histidine kinase